MKNTRSAYITVGAIVAAVYVGLNLISAALGLAYGPIQLRLSEALSILPLFTSAAVPGLTIGCLVSNFIGGNPVDIVVGTLATLIAALLTRALRNVKVKNYPLVSFLPPVIINAAAIGAELTLLYEPKSIFIQMFAINALQVAAGQAVAVFGLGTLLYLALNKKKIL